MLCKSPMTPFPPVLDLPRARALCETRLGFAEKVARWPEGSVLCIHHNLR
jgi:hypothetical protein